MVMWVENYTYYGATVTPRATVWSVLRNCDHCGCLECYGRRRLFPPGLYRYTKRGLLETPLYEIANSSAHMHLWVFSGFLGVHYEKMCFWGSRARARLKKLHSSAQFIRKYDCILRNVHEKSTKYRYYKTMSTFYCGMGSTHAHVHTRKSFIRVHKLWIFGRKRIPRIPRIPRITRIPRIPRICVHLVSATAR